MKLRRQRDDSDDLLGRTLDGRWLIESRIGEGGMGTVYLGSQRSVNRAVAIKTLRPELASNDEFVDRFFLEARLATTINHPHCITVLDFGQTEEGLLYMAMELLEGEELSDRLARQGRLEEPAALAIADQIAAALEAAHAHGVIHRDLKPDNVFLQQTAGGDLHVKLLDFGIAKSIDGSTKMTKTGQIFGTPQYMSPEQCGGEPIDGRSDLYALGCILYEMLSGAPPFDGDNVMAVLMAHINEAVSPIESKVAVSDKTRRVIEILLEKSRDRRYADASALRSALSRPGAAQGQGSPYQAQASGAPIASDSALSERAGPGFAVRAGLAATLLMLIAGCVAALFLLQGGGPAASASPAASPPMITAAPSPATPASPAASEPSERERDGTRAKEKEIAPAKKKGELGDSAARERERDEAREKKKTEIAPEKAKIRKKRRIRKKNAPPKKKRASKSMPRIKERKKSRGTKIERKLNRTTKAVGDLFR